MRHIDADKLRKEIVEKRNRTVAPQSTIDILNWVIRQIRRQPTVHEKKIGHCKDCKHWRAYPSSCPMMFEEWFYREDWEETDSIIHDNTRDDGMGYCDKFERYDKDEME